MPASEPQHASVACQLSPAARCTGTVTPAARAAPPNSDMEYRPVISPDLAAKSRLIRPGSSTLATAMPAPMTTVPANSATTESSSRSAVPAQISAMVPSSERSMPKRRPSRGAIGASRPKQSSGSAVSRLVAAAVMPLSSRMVPASGDTATRAGRRLSARRMTPAPR